MASTTLSEPAASEGTAAPDLSALFREQASSPEGLTSAEARKRLEQYGPNALEEKKASALLLFLGYFWGPIPWMIEVAAVLSAIVGHWVDLIIILVLLAVQRRRGVLAGASGGQCRRGAQEATRPQGPRQTRRPVDGNRRGQPGAGRHRAPAPGRHHPRRRAADRRRLPERGPVGADGRIAAGGQEGSATSPIPAPWPSKARWSRW